MTEKRLEDKTLEELANIKFPKPLHRRKAVHLVGEVAKKGNYLVRLGGEFTGTLERGRIDIYTTKICGTIWAGDLTNTAFELKRADGDNYREFDTLLLNSIGRDYDEIESDEAKLWMDINKYVLEAFNHNPKS